MQTANKQKQRDLQQCTGAVCKLTYKEWKILIKTWQRDIEGERKKEREREREREEKLQTGNEQSNVEIVIENDMKKDRDSN